MPRGKQLAPAKSRWETVGEMYRRGREQLGITKSAASRRARVSLTTWRLIEAGSAENPTNHTLVRMARAVRLSPADILAAAGREVLGTEEWDFDFPLESDPAVAAEVAAENLSVLTAEENFRLAVSRLPVDARAKRFLLESYELMLQRGTV